MGTVLVERPRHWKVVGARALAGAHAAYERQFGGQRGERQRRRLSVFILGCLA